MTKKQIAKGNIVIGEALGESHWEAWSIGGYKRHWANTYKTKNEVIEALNKHYGSVKHNCEAKLVAPNYYEDYLLLIKALDKVRYMPTINDGQKLKKSKIGDIFSGRFELGRYSVFMEFYKWTEMGWEIKSFYNIHIPKDNKNSSVKSYKEAIWKTLVDYFTWANEK